MDETPEEAVSENEQKRARVLERLVQPDAADLSDREIARELGVSQPFVSKLRKSLSPAEGDQDDAPATSEPTAADTLATLEREEGELQGRIETLRQQRVDVSRQLVRGTLRGSATGDPIQPIFDEIERAKQRLEAIADLKAAAEELLTEQRREAARRVREEALGEGDAAAADFVVALTALDTALLETVAPLIAPVREAIHRYRGAVYRATRGQPTRLTESLARLDLSDRLGDRLLATCRAIVEEREQGRHPLAPWARDYTARLFAQARQLLDVEPRPAETPEEF